MNVHRLAVFRHELRKNAGEPRHEARSSAYEVQHLLQQLRPFALEQPANDLPSPSSEKSETVVTPCVSPPQTYSEDGPTSLAECPPVETTPSQSSQDSRDSCGSQATQSTILPPYTEAELLPPSFSDDAPATLVLAGPVSDEPQDVTAFPAPEPVWQLDISPDAEVSLMFDGPTFEEPSTSSVPVAHTEPAPPMSYPDNAEVLFMLDPPISQVPYHNVEEHHTSSGAQVVTASGKKHEASPLPNKRQWPRWKHTARHAVQA